MNVQNSVRLKQGRPGLSRPNQGQSACKPEVSKEPQDSSALTSLSERQLIRKPSGPKVDTAKSGRDSGIRTALVIGGGPAGLAAALALTKLDCKVTVVEMRADESGEHPLHARPHQISLRQDSLETFKEHGAYEDLMSKSGYATREERIHHGPERVDFDTKEPQAVHTARDTIFLNPAFIHSDSTSQIRISDGEKALYKQALEQGVEFRVGEVADLVHDEQTDNYSALLQKAEVTNDGQLKRHGPQQTFEADLVVAADGAGSPTRKAVGIEFLEESEPVHYLGGLVSQGIGPVTRKVTVNEEDGLKRHIMGTGHDVYDDTWVSVEVTPTEAALPKEERIALLQDKAKYAVNRPVELTDITWGAGHVTTVANRRAEKTTAGNNLVLIGDAAGTGSVWVGGGLNLALTTHLKALENLVVSSRIPHRENHFNIYDRTLQWATTHWHKAGAGQLKSSD